MARRDPRRDGAAGRRRRYQSRVGRVAESIHLAGIPWPGRLYRITWPRRFNRIAQWGPLQDVGEVFGAALTALQRQSRAAVVLSAVAAAPLVLQTILPPPPIYLPLAPVLALWGVLHTAGSIQVWHYVPEMKRLGIQLPFEPQWTLTASLLDVLWAAVLSFVGAALMLVTAGNDGQRGAIGALRALLPWFRPLAYAAMLSGVLTVVVTDVIGDADGALAKSLGATGIAAINALLLCALAPLFLVAQLAFAFAVLEHASAVTALKLAWRRALGLRRRHTWVLAVAIIATYIVPTGILESFVRYVPNWLYDLTWWWWRLVLLLVNMALFTFLTAVIAVVAKDYQGGAQSADLDAALDTPQPS